MSINYCARQGSITAIDCLSVFTGSMRHKFILLIIWLSSFHDAVGQSEVEPMHMTAKSESANPPSTGILYPIEISPAVIPQFPRPNDSWAPMYPSFPTTYEPTLTRKCPVNFSAMSDIFTKTASDCTQILAYIVGNVICCPQMTSLMHMFQGFYSRSSDKLVVNNAVADDCFSDIISILVSRGANSSVAKICSIKSSNLTGGSCPVNDVATFEKKVNASKLLDACSSVDPLKECCRPICQPAIMEAAIKISGGELTVKGDNSAVQEASRLDTLNDCKGVVYSYISRKLSADAANAAFRRLSNCKVNKVCPLEFEEPTAVVNACRNAAAPSPSCCSSLNSYIDGVQRQMLITNKQAIICATIFGSMLRRGGVITNVYELCDIDLKDFSIQGSVYGQEVAGCLLRSYPSDMLFDNSTGYSFTCDLTDNIEAPWPSSSSLSSVSLCAPEMSLPALPTSETMKNPGCRCGGLEIFVSILSFFAVGALLY